VFHFSDRFLGQNLLDREHLVRWITVMVENPITGTKFKFFLCTAPSNCYGIST
jgi:hypothetical protein